MSDPINNLSAALARAQATMNTAEKDGDNPHYKSTYSTLEQLISVSRPSLTKEGLSVVQFRDFEDGNDFLVTQLRHASGEMIVGRALIYLKEKTDIQKLGAAITYSKRYEYAAICGIAMKDFDDDGNSNSTENTSDQAPQRPANLITEKQEKYLNKLLDGKTPLKAEICVEHGVTSIAQLSSRAASEAIKRLEGK